MWWLSFCGGWLAVGGSLELEQSCVVGWLAVGLKPLSCSCPWWLGAGAGNDRLTKWRCWLLGGWSGRAKLIHAITLRGFHLGFVRLRLERVWVCDVFVWVYVMCVCVRLKIFWSDLNFLAQTWPETKNFRSKCEKI